MIAEASVAKGLTMKSLYRICVVLSTVLVLGNSHHQNYQQPGNYRDQEPGNYRAWSQEPQNPVHQWSTNYEQSAQSSPGPETENYQGIQQYPIEIDSFAPINPNEASHHAQRTSHAHRIRQISIPLKEPNNHEGTRVIRLPPNGDPKDLKVMLTGTNNSTVYEENNVPDAVKEILARALAVNRGEAEIIHSESPVNEQLVNAEPVNTEPVNTEPINVQTHSVNAQTVGRSPSRPLARLRPRNRRQGFKGPPNSAMAGYPHRRRRPFQRYPNIRGPARRPNKVFPSSDKAKAIIANKTVTLLPERGIKTTFTVIKPVDSEPENAEVKTTVEEIKFITKDEQSKVVAESIDNETTTVNDKNPTILQADKDKSISLALDDIYVTDDLHIASGDKLAYKPDKLDKFGQIWYVLPEKSLPAPAYINISGLIDKPVSTPKALVQPTLLDAVSTQPKAADAIATSKSVPTNFNNVDVSPVHQTKTNIFTSALTLPNDDSIPIKTKLGKTLPKSVNDITNVTSKTKDDDDDVFPNNLSKTLLTETDDVVATTVTSITVTEPTPTPTNPNEDDDSSIVLTTTTDLTPAPTDIYNSKDITDKYNSVIVLSTTETSPTVASTNQDLSKPSEAVTKPTIAPIRSLKIIHNESPINKELVNTGPVNTQPINFQDQSVNAKTVGRTPSKSLARLRPRNRRPGFKGLPNSAMAGYPHRRRRPFQRYPIIRGPARRPHKVFTSSDKAIAIIANTTETVLPESGIKTTVTVIKPVDGMPENAEDTTTVEEIKFITKDGQPKVVAESIDKETTIVSDKNQIIQADKIKSITPATVDKNVNYDLHVVSKDKTASTPHKFYFPDVLPDNAVKSVSDKLVTPKAFIQPILLDDVPTYPKADAIATSKTEPTEVDISPTILQTKANILPSALTLPNDDSVPIDTKLSKFLPKSDNDISIVSSKTTLTESKSLPIQPEDNDDILTTVTEPTTIPNGDDSFVSGTKLLESLFTTIDDTLNTPSTTKSILPTNLNDGDDDVDVFPNKLSKTLLTEIDDVATTTVISTTVTEPTPTPTNLNEDDDSSIVLTTITDLTPVPTDINNSNDTTDKFNSVIVLSTTETSPTVASTNQDLSKLAEAVTKSTIAPTKFSKIIDNESPVKKELVNTEPINVQAQPVNVQTLGRTPSRPLARLRPRNRRPGFKGLPNSAMAGYPHRQRRPFQRHQNIRGPARRPNKVFPSSEKAKAIIANKTETVLPESGIETTFTVIKPVNGMPENAEVKTTVEEIKFITKPKQQPKVDFIDEETIIIVSDKNQIIQADEIKSITPKTADKAISEDLHAVSNDKSVFTPDEFDFTDVLSDNAVKSVPAPVHIPDDKPVSTHKALVQPIILDDGPTYSKADAIATSKSLPTNDIDISPIALQTEENILTSVLTLPKDDRSPKTTLTESKSLPIQPEDSNDVLMDASTTILSTTVTDPTPTPTIPNGDDGFVFASKLLDSLFTTIDDTPNSSSTTKPLPTNPNDDEYDDDDEDDDDDDDDDDDFPTKPSQTLLTETDDVTTTAVISTAVTEPTPTPTNPNEDDSVLFATKLIQSLLTTDNDDSFSASTTTTDLTPAATDTNNNDDTTDDHNSDVIETASTEASTNQDLSKLSREVTKPTLAPIKSLKTDNLKNPDGSYSSFNTLHLNPPSYIDELTGEEQNKNPYVIISRLPSEDGITTEPSLFTTIITYIIGNKENKFAKTSDKDVELQLSGGEHLKNTKEDNNDKKKIDEVSVTDTKDKTSKSNTVATLTELKESKIFDQDKLALTKTSKKEMKVTAKDDKIFGVEDSEENAVITSADVAIPSEEGPMTPISFVVDLVRSALKGGDSLRALISDQRVKDFILNIFNIN